MREDCREAEGAFYAACAAILGCEHAYRPWTGRGPNRWNNRAPGNGRFPGFGTVRFFGPGCIHVSLHAPRAVNRPARSAEEAYAILRAAMAPGPGGEGGAP